MATVISGRLVWRRLYRAAGEAALVFLGLGSSSLGWLPALTGLPLSGFLVAIGIVSLGLGWRMATGEAAT